MHPMVATALERDRTARGHKSRLAGVAAALANVQMFAMCSKKELRTVADVAKLRTIARGTRLIAEGEKGDRMFVILSGTARVSRGGRKIAALGSGDVVGELALLSRSPRNATVDAETDLDVAEIGRAAFGRLLYAVPSFAQKLLEAMAIRVQTLDRKAWG
jgi:CRP-like cAMP-binding protein